MLNLKHYVLLAGDPRAWDEEMVRRGHMENLAAIQIDQHRRGRRSANLVETMTLGWTVRYASNLDDRALLFGGRALGRQASQREAIAAGIAWVEEDPSNREFFALQSDVICDHKYEHGRCLVVARHWLEHPSTEVRCRACAAHLAVMSEEGFVELNDPHAVAREAGLNPK